MEYIRTVIKTTPRAMRVFGAQTLEVPGTPSLVSGGSGGCVKNLFECAREQVDVCTSNGLGAAAARNCDLAIAKHGLSEDIATGLKDNCSQGLSFLY